MDQYFMDLYRTRLYLPLVFLILAYVVSPQFRRIFTKAERWIDDRKTWQTAAGCAAVSFFSVYRRHLFREKLVRRFQPVFCSGKSNCNRYHSGMIRKEYLYH